MKPHISHCETQRQYIITTPHGHGLTAYFRKGKDTVFYHTEVPTEDRGHGYASQLVKYALVQEKAAKHHIVALCPFVRWYLQQHPEEG